MLKVLRIDRMIFVVYKKCNKTKNLKQIYRRKILTLHTSSMTSSDHTCWP